MIAVGDPVSASRGKGENPSDRYTDPLLENISFALDLDRKPEEEWSPYEKRRMRKLSERISRGGLLHWLPRAGHIDVSRG